MVIYVNTKETIKHSSTSFFFFSFLWVDLQEFDVLPLGFARLHQLQSYQAEASHIPLHQPRQQFQNLQ